MSSNVGTVGSVSGGVVTPVVATPAPSANASSSSSFSSAVHAASASAAPLENPRIIQDPSAGYITEYLSANGSQIISQTPSAITVAYLRQGLTADGTPKHRATTA